MYFNALKSFFSSSAFLGGKERKHKTEEHYIIQILSTSYQEPLQKNISLFFFLRGLRRQNIKNSLMMRKKFSFRIIRNRSFFSQPRKSQTLFPIAFNGELLSQIRKKREACDVLIERLIKFLISGNCSRLTMLVIDLIL